MRKIIVYCAVAFLAAGTLSGCVAGAPSGSPTAKSAPVEPSSDAKPYDFRTEGKIPPLSPDVPSETDVEEIGVTESAIEVTDAVAPPDTAREAAPPATPTTMIDGFRVQVFASADREIAENAARVAEERLSIPSYVDLDGGVYKVRVGDFVTRPDADQALPAIRRQYTDAWVVATQVRAAQKAP